MGCCTSYGFYGTHPQYEKYRTEFETLMFKEDDADHSGEIDNSEIAKMLRDIYGKDYENNAYAKKLSERIFKELGAEITVAEFREFVRKYPALLFPAFQLQDGISSRVMGTDFWKFFSERRMKLSGSRYIEIGEFMALHTNKGAVDAVLGAHNSGDGLHGHTTVDIHKEKVKDVLAKTGTIQNRMSSKSGKGGSGSLRGAGMDNDAPLGYKYTADSCSVDGSLDTAQPVALRFSAQKGKKPASKSPSSAATSAATDKKKLGLMRIQSGKELDDQGKLSDYFQEMEANHRKPRGKGGHSGRGAGLDDDLDPDRLSDEDDEMTVDRSSQFLQAGAMSRDRDEQSFSSRMGSMMLLGRDRETSERSASNMAGSMAAGKSSDTTPRRRKSVSKTEDEERSASTRSFKVSDMNMALAGGNNNQNNSNAGQKDQHYRLKGDRSPKRHGDAEGSAQHQLVGAMAAGGPHRTNVDPSIAVGLNEGSTSAAQQRRRSRGELSLTGGSIKAGSMVMNSPDGYSGSQRERRQSRGELSLTGGSIRTGSMNVMGSSASTGAADGYGSKKNKRSGSSEPTMAERVAVAQAAGASGASSSGNGQSQSSLKAGMHGDNFYAGNYYEGPIGSRKK